VDFSLARRGAASGSSYTTSDVVAREIHARFGDRHLLLLTDFDGTLADLAPTPDEAFLAPAVRNEIDRLAARPAVTFGVVSGRRLLDVARRVGPAATFVAGLHGLEISGPGTSFHHYALESVGAVVASLMQTASRQLAWCPGVYLEDKTYALTCHVRLAPAELADRALEEFEALAEPLVEARILKLITGAKALELLPAVDWHKGRACEWIRGRMRVSLHEPIGMVYLGDDRTDEDAFASLGPDDVVIGVGERPHSHLIDWRLAGPASVGRLFGQLAGLR
jgi:trehalose 6-phosphate phosphatase